MRWKFILPILIFILIIIYPIILKNEFNIALLYIIQPVFTFISILFLSKFKLNEWGFKGFKLSVLLKPSIIVLTITFLFIFLDSFIFHVSEGPSFVNKDSIYSILFSPIIFSPINEELLIRGLIQSSLSSIKFKILKFKGIVITFPVFISAFLFGLVHLVFLIMNHEIYLAYYMFFLSFNLGLVLAYYREKTASIYVSIIIHSIANIFITMFGYLARIYL